MILYISQNIMEFEVYNTEEHKFGSLEIGKLGTLLIANQTNYWINDYSDVIPCHFHEFYEFWF